jgi:NADH-quinone oxidoreductase subunit D
VLKTLDQVSGYAAEVDSLLVRNRIFVDRTKGTGVITKDDALDFGFTGPCLRACGVSYDVRKAKPYWVYDRLQFDVPVGHNGDNFDRYMMRTLEIQQSIRLIKQAFEQMPEGPIMIDDWRIALPPKEEVYGTIEGVIAHFKLVMEGVPVPAGETYHCTETANGELGWFLKSDGSGRPYKCHVRAPGFHMLSGFARMCEGRMLADLVPTFDTINMIGGEVEQ